MLMVSSQQRAEDFLQQTEEYSLIIALPTPPFPSLLIPVPPIARIRHADLRFPPRQRVFSA